MKNLLGHALLLTLVVTIEASDGKEANKTDNAVSVAAIEEEILRSMEGGMGETLSNLRKRLRSLPAETRRTLAVAVSPGVYEWRFSGVHPKDVLVPVMLEYVVSSDVKNYESLLVVKGKELERVRRFGQALNTLRRRRPDSEVNVRLSWTEGDRVRTVDLWEIFALVEAAEIQRFTQQLSGNDDGIGAINLEADTAALPEEKTPAQVIVTVRMPKRR